MKQKTHQLNARATEQELKRHQTLKTAFEKYGISESPITICERIIGNMIEEKGEALLLSLMKNYGAEPEEKTKKPKK